MQGSRNIYDIQPFDGLSAAYGNADYLPRLTVDTNKQYGQGLPAAMLMSKFEETLVDYDEEDLYNNYARGELKDRRPDKSKFEHEEARGAVNARAGYLQLLHGGHRGDSEEPRHPEMFLGFTDPDPRGTAVDPNFKELARQQNSRMRFVRWSPDGCEQTTGGGRSESKAVADNQTLFRWASARMKWFSTQKDGRRNGMRRDYEHASTVSKQLPVHSYSDAIRDDGITPQRRSVIISDRILRDLPEYRAECCDGIEAAHSYDAVSRRAGPGRSARTGFGGTGSAELSDQDLGKCYRALVILMADLANARAGRQRDGDISYEDAADAQARSQARAKDIAVIMSAIAQDSTFQDAGGCQSRKTPGQVTPEQIMNLVAEGHITPAHFYLDGDKFYKSLAKSIDTYRAQMESARDGASRSLREEQPGARRGRHGTAGAVSREGRVCICTDSSQIHSYKSKAPQSGHMGRNIAGGQRYGESDLTVSGRTPHGKYGVVQKTSHGNDMLFSDHGDGQTHGAPLGVKSRARRFADREDIREEFGGRHRRH